MSELAVHPQQKKAPGTRKNAPTTQQLTLTESLVELAVKFYSPQRVRKVLHPDKVFGRLAMPGAA